MRWTSAHSSRRFDLLRGLPQDQCALIQFNIGMYVGFRKFFPTNIPWTMLFIFVHLLCVFEWTSPFVHCINVDGEEQFYVLPEQKLAGISELREVLSAAEPLKPEVDRNPMVSCLSMLSNYQELCLSYRKRKIFVVTIFRGLNFRGD